ncbi:hypothetical protein F4801DRAFT_188270 [Xylaria longipes]|nr:hypothetical protein F4801DRAFT_188270 [Xylaria longipes]
MSLVVEHLSVTEKVAYFYCDYRSSGTKHIITEIGRVFDSYSELEIKAIPSDIRSYTKWMISSNDELSELMPESSKQDIVQRVIDQSSGMFLAAVLLCTHLTHLSRFSEIRSAVQTHSKGLDDIYNESMQRIMLQPREKRTTAIKALSWIYHSKRQLTVEELVHALAINSDETIPAYEDVISERAVLDLCDGLIVIDATNKGVRFVHHTLQEHFEGTYTEWFSGEQLKITKACLIYVWCLRTEASLIYSHPTHS